MERKNKFDRKLLAILDGACQVFAERGYHNTSVRDVAAVTGVSPAGLYYYFRSKEELLHLILESCISSLMERLRRDTAGIENPASRLRSIIKTHLDYFKTNRNEMRVLVREWDTLSGNLGGEIRALMKEYARLVIGTFKDLSPDKSSRELRAAGFGLLGMLTWVDQWYRPDRDLPLNLLAEQFASIFLGGFPSRDLEEAGRKADEGEPSPPSWSESNAASSILSGPGF